MLILFNFCWWSSDENLIIKKNVKFVMKIKQFLESIVGFTQFLNIFFKLIKILKKIRFLLILNKKKKKIQSPSYACKQRRLTSFCSIIHLTCVDLPAASWYKDLKYILWVEIAKLPKLMHTNCVKKFIAQFPLPLPLLSLTYKFIF